LIPYFKKGLENNEFCLWIICEPMTTEEALDALQGAIPNLAKYIEKKSIEIHSCRDWYINAGKFDINLINEAWQQKLNDALSRGYDGMRINGNETWLEKNHWDSFMEYERALHDLLQDQKMIVLCTYPLLHSDGRRVLDVAHAHEWAISCRQGHWEILEEPELKMKKADLLKDNKQLDALVAERTKELSEAVNELRKEIEERKKTERQVRYEKDLSNEIIESIPGYLLLINKNYEILLCNKQFESMFGYTSAEIQTLHPVEYLFNQEGRANAYKLVEKVFSTGYLSGESNIQRKDGTEVTVYFIARSILYENSVCMLTIGVDITERKKAEEQIKRQAELSNEIIDAIPIMAWSLLPDGKLEFVNQRWLDYTGLSLEEAIKKPTGIIHPENLPGSMQKWVANRAAIKAYDDEMLLKRADGEYCWFLVRTAPLQNKQGNVVKWFGVAIDIEDSKHAQDELRLAYQRLSYHVENTPLAVIEFDKNLFITRWSKRAEEIFGWKASEALGKNVYDPDFPIIYKEDIQAVDKINEQLMKGIVNGNMSLNRNYTKEGKVIYNEWYNSVLRDEYGNIITILSLTYDVTTRMEAEEKLNESYRQIRLLSENLQNIREEERTHIAREIHDELGQQLTVMKMDASWLKKKLTDTDYAIKEKIEDLIQILNITVQSVRKISYELRPHLLDLGLSDAIEWHLKEFEKRSGIKTSFNESSEKLELADSIKTGLFRICQESLTNVARHSKAKQVQADLIKNNGQLVLSITDNGKGFNIQKINERNTLGILGMKERAAMMGGNYDIESEPGRGTIVTVTIPLKKKEQL
jgi:PAS domain S-box-containing protein